MQGQSFEDQPYFTEYFKGTQMPKFVFYSAHAEEMYPLLAALDHLLMTEAPPASAVFLDFFTDSQGQDKVQVVF